MTMVAVSRQRKHSTSNSDPCFICGDPVFIIKTSAGRGKMAHRACRQTSSAEFRHDAECIYCGVRFASLRRSNGVKTRCCSRSCARKAELSEGRLVLFQGVRVGRDPEKRKRSGEVARRGRRARLLGVKRDIYTTADILARDGCECSLCGEVVELSLKYPDSLSVSVDHVVPVSKGGDDTLANVAVAHLICNLRKGNRLGVCDGDEEVESS